MLPTGSTVKMMAFESTMRRENCKSEHLTYVVEGEMRFTLKGLKGQEKVGEYSPDAKPEDTLQDVFIARAGDIYYIPSTTHTCEIVSSNGAKLLMLDELFDLSLLRQSGEPVLKSLFNPVTGTAISEKADLSRSLPHLTINAFSLTPSVQLAIASFDKGFSWEKDIKPTVQTDLCEESHMLYGLSGSMHCSLKEGLHHREDVMGAGDFLCMPPHHDGVVMGDKPVIALTFHNFIHYASKK
jgi:quercetin dioxygenase-like cupin family protein